jgi:hypothetical protein
LKGEKRARHVRTVIYNGTSHWEELGKEECGNLQIDDNASYRKQEDQQSPENLGGLRSVRFDDLVHGDNIQG